MTSNDIAPHNDKDEAHGYWETYHDNGQLHFKGNHINDKQHGYWEYYYPNGQLRYKGNFVKDRKSTRLNSSH